MPRDSKLPFGGFPPKQTGSASLAGNWITGTRDLEVNPKAFRPDVGFNDVVLWTLKLE